MYFRTSQFKTYHWGCYSMWKWSQKKGKLDNHKTQKYGSSCESFSFSKCLYHIFINFIQYKAILRCSTILYSYFIDICVYVERSFYNKSPRKKLEYAAQLPNRFCCSRQYLKTWLVYLCKLRVLWPFFLNYSYKVYKNDNRYC